MAGKVTTDEINARKAVAAKKREHRMAERLGRAAARKSLRDRLGVYDNVVYFHLRGRICGHYTKGGICVAVKRLHSKCLIAAASVCARGDCYDKLEARRYAFDRLDGEPGDIFPTLTLTAEAGRVFEQQEATLVLMRLAAINAVASLGKKSDRVWFEGEILAYMD